MGFRLKNVPESKNIILGIACLQNIRKGFYLMHNFSLGKAPVIELHISYTCSLNIFISDKNLQEASVHPSCQKWARGAEIVTVLTSEN